ncbi:MAG: hypothetical protein ACK4Y4_09195 [Brevundimonas sp.]
MIAVLLAMTPVPASGLDGAYQEPREEIRVQSDSLSSLAFLVGRWSGQSPDGSTFYDEYTFGPDGQFRSRRFEDGAFTTSTDGSSVEIEDGQIVSKWGPFTWRAVRLEDGFAEFEPLNAPSSFSWKRIDADHVEVSQRWTDEAGAAQGYSLILTRVAPPHH